MYFKRDRGMILCDGAWWDQMKCVQHQDSSDVCAAWPGMWRLRTQRLAGSAPSPRRGRGPRAATGAGTAPRWGRQTSQPPADSGSFSSSFIFLTAFSSSVLTSSDSTTVAIAREALGPKREYLSGHERAQAIELSVLAAVSCRAANSRVFVGFGGAGAATTSQAAARDPREMARRELGGELADCKTLAKSIV